MCVARRQKKERSRTRACTFLWLCMWCSLGGMFCGLHALSCGFACGAVLVACSADWHAWRFACRHMEACRAPASQHSGTSITAQGSSITAATRHAFRHSAISSRASGMQPAGTCSHQACMDFSIQPSGMHGIHIFCGAAAAFPFVLAMVFLFGFKDPMPQEARHSYSIDE